MSRPDPDTLLRRIWPPGDALGGRSVFAVIDAARDPRIEALIHRSGLPAACLYAGVLPPELAAVAPYLVQLDRDAALVRTLLGTGWSNAWCIYAVCDAGVTLQDLRKHCRSLLRVEHPDGPHFLFRYYDPRVFRVYLPTCEPAETSRMFGPVRHFLYESADGTDLLCHLPTTGNPAVAARHDAARTPPLAIRPAQVDAFDDALQPAFGRRLCTLLRRHQARDTSHLDDDALRALVDRGLQRAKCHGLRWERSLGDFVSLAVSVGEEFDTHPRIAALLSDETIDMESRMRSILATVEPREWDDIRATCAHRN